MTVELVTKTVRYQGVAADTKPTPVADGSRFEFLELDTDTTYVYDFTGATWQAQASVSVTLNAGDVEIGAVEIKNGTDDTRAVVGTASGIAEANNALAVQAPVLGVTTGTKVITDANGTLQQYLRGIVHLIISKIGVTVASGDDVTEGATADAAVITDATGTVSGKLRGLVKWAFERMPAALGQTTASASLPVVLASDQTQPVSGKTITITPTMSASPDYSAGDGLGGIQTLATVVASNSLSALLKSICVSDKAGQAPQITIYFFKATPAAGTYTDNDALAWGAGDAANMIGIVKFVSADYKTVGGISTACLGAVDQLHTPAATSVFVIIEVDAAYNGASTSDLTLVFGYDRK